MSQKIFCIGWCKTATTSLEHALRALKLKGPRNVGLELLEDIIEKKYKKMYDVIQDFDYFIVYPWFYKDLYKHLHKKYPNALFILTVRDEDTWIKSTTLWFDKDGKSHKKKRNEEYRGPKNDHLLFKTVYGDLDQCLGRYKKHNDKVIDYFKDKPEQLLVFNAFAGDGYKKLCNFLKKSIPKKGDFPHRNKQKYDKTVFLKEVK